MDFVDFGNCQNCLALHKKLELFELLKQKCSKNDDIVKNLLTLKKAYEKATKLLESKSRKISELKIKLRDTDKNEELYKRKAAEYQLRLVSIDNKYQELQKDMEHVREKFFALEKEKQSLHDRLELKENEVTSLFLLAKQSELHHNNEIDELTSKLEKCQDVIKEMKKDCKSKGNREKKYQNLVGTILTVFKENNYNLVGESLKKWKRLVSRLRSKDIALKLEAELNSPSLTPDGTTSLDTGIFSDEEYCEKSSLTADLQMSSDDSDSELEDVPHASLPSPSYKTNSDLSLKVSSPARDSSPRPSAAQRVIGDSDNSLNSLNEEDTTLCPMVNGADQETLIESPSSSLALEAATCPSSFCKPSDEETLIQQEETLSNFANGCRTTNNIPSTNSILVHFEGQMSPERNASQGNYPPTSNQKDDSVSLDHSSFLTSFKPSTASNLSASSHLLNTIVVNSPSISTLEGGTIHQSPSESPLPGSSTCYPVSVSQEVSETDTFCQEEACLVDEICSEVQDVCVGINSETASDNTGVDFEKASESTEEIFPEASEGPEVNPRKAFENVKCDAEVMASLEDSSEAVVGVAEVSLEEPLQDEEIHLKEGSESKNLNTVGECETMSDFSEENYGMADINPKDVCEGTFEKTVVNSAESGDGTLKCMEPCSEVLPVSESLPDLRPLTLDSGLTDLSKAGKASSKVLDSDFSIVPGRSLSRTSGISTFDQDLFDVNSKIASNSSSDIGISNNFNQTNVNTISESLVDDGTMKSQVSASTSDTQKNIENLPCLLDATTSDTCSIIEEDCESPDLELLAMLKEWNAPTPVLPFSDDSNSFEVSDKSNSQPCDLISENISSSFASTLMSSHLEQTLEMRGNSPCKRSIGTNTDSPLLISTASSPISLSSVDLSDETCADQACSPRYGERKVSSIEIATSPIRVNHQDKSVMPIAESRKNASLSPIKANCHDVGVMPISELRKNVSVSPIKASCRDVGIMPISELRKDASVSPIKASCKDVGIVPISELRKNACVSPNYTIRDNTSSSVKLLLRDNSTSPIKSTRKDGFTMTLDELRVDDDRGTQMLPRLNRDNILSDCSLGISKVPLNRQSASLPHEVKMLQQALDALGVHSHGLTDKVFDETFVEELRICMEIALRKVCQNEGNLPEQPMYGDRSNSRSFCFFSPCEFAEICDQQHYNLHLLAKSKNLEKKMCSFRSNKCKVKRLKKHRLKKRKQPITPLKQEWVEENLDTTVLTRTLSPLYLTRPEDKIQPSFLKSSEIIRPSLLHQSEITSTPTLAQAGNDEFSNQSNNSACIAQFQDCSVASDPHPNSAPGFHSDTSAGAHTNHEEITDGGQVSIISETVASDPHPNIAPGFLSNISVSAHTNHEEMTDGIQGSVISETGSNASTPEDLGETDADGHLDHMTAPQVKSPHIVKRRADCKRAGSLSESSCEGSAQNCSMVDDAKGKPRRSPRVKKVKVAHEWDPSSRSSYKLGYMKVVKGGTVFVRSMTEELHNQHQEKSGSLTSEANNKETEINNVVSPPTNKPMNQKGLEKSLNAENNPKIKQKCPSSKKRLSNCEQSNLRRSKRLRISTPEFVSSSDDSDGEKLIIASDVDDLSDKPNRVPKGRDEEEAEKSRDPSTSDVNNIHESNSCVSDSSAKESFQRKVVFSGSSPQRKPITKKQSKLQRMRTSVSKVHPLAQALKVASSSGEKNEEPIPNSLSPKHKESRLPNPPVQENNKSQEEILEKFRGRECIRMAAAASGRTAQLIEIASRRKVSAARFQNLVKSMKKEPVAQPFVRPQDRLSAIATKALNDRKSAEPSKNIELNIPAAPHKQATAFIQNSATVEVLEKPLDQSDILNNDNLNMGLNQTPAGNTKTSSEGRHLPFLSLANRDVWKTSRHPLACVISEAIQDQQDTEINCCSKVDKNNTETLVKETLQALIAAPSFTAHVLQKAMNNLSNPDLPLILHVVVRDVVQTMVDDHDSPFSPTGYAKPATPLLSFAQQKLLTLILSLSSSHEHFKELPLEVLKLLEYKVFRLGKAPELPMLKWCSRFYAAVCRALCLRSRALIFCWDALYCFRGKAYHVIEPIVDVWPQLFPVKPSYSKACPNAQVMLHILRCRVEKPANQGRKFNSSNSLKTMLRNIEQETHSVNSQILAAEIFSNILSGGNSTNVTALVLLAKAEAEAWTMKDLVSGKLLPTLDRWRNRSLDDSVGEPVIWALCSILRALSPERNGCTYDALIKLLKSELLLNENARISEHMQEIIAIGLALLSRHDVETVASTLLTWNPKHGATTGYSACLQQYLSSTVKCGFRKLIWWNDQVTNHRM